MTDTTSFGSGYVLGPVIGRGAMGRVHRATPRDGGADVAIKILREDLAAEPDVVARFVQERQVLRSVSHPNVVRVHDLIVEGDRLGIVMDYVSGGDLRHSTAVPSQLDHAIPLLAQAADGLSAVHAAGVVHRDLKPDNILVDESNDALTLRLTDFGVSRLIGHTITRVTSLIGTPGYLAPEVAAGNSPTNAADLYALGVMLFESCTGRPPFEADNLVALIRAHAEDAVPQPDGIPRDLWQLLQALMCKQPEGRPSAIEAAAAMRSVGPSLSGVGPMSVPERQTIVRSSGQAAASVPSYVDATVARAPSQPPTDDTVLRSKAPPAAIPAPRNAQPVKKSARGLRPAAVVACVAVVALVVGLVAVKIRGGGGTTTVQTAVTHAFKPVVYAGGIVVARTWELQGNDGERLQARVAVTNSGEAKGTASHFEVIPKEVARDVSDITFKPAPTEVIKADPVVRYDLSTLEPGESLTLTYEVRLPARGRSTPRLEHLARDKERADDEFRSTNTTTPQIELASLSLDQTSLALATGETRRLNVTGAMSDGSPAPAPALAGLVWTSSAPGTATVSAGEVTGVKSGVAVITASAGDLYASANVTVKGPRVASGGQGVRKGGGDDTERAPATTEHRGSDSRTTSPFDTEPTTTSRSGKTTPTTRSDTDATMPATTIKPTTTTKATTTTAKPTTTTAKPTTTAPPSPQVSLGFGGDGGGACQGQPCRWLVISWANFGAGDHNYRCVSARDGQQFYAQSTSPRPSGSSGSGYQLRCWAGRGYPVWVEVDGVRSNTAQW